MEVASNTSGFSRRRIAPRLRFFAGRAIYLLTRDQLDSLQHAAGSFPELAFHATVMQAVASGGVDRALDLGTNGAQAVAQALRFAERTAHLAQPPLGNVQVQSYAMFLLNGVAVEGPPLMAMEHDLLEFATVGATPRLMKGGQPFVREIACLHGLLTKSRHVEMLESVYDEDESQVLDAIDLATNSWS